MTLACSESLCLSVCKRPFLYCWIKEYSSIAGVFHGCIKRIKEGMRDKVYLIREKGYWIRDKREDKDYKI